MKPITCYLNSTFFCVQKSSLAKQKEKSLSAPCYQRQEAFSYINVYFTVTIKLNAKLTLSTDKVARLQ